MSSEARICAECGGSTWLLGDDGEPRPCHCRPGRVRRARTRGLVSTIPKQFRGVAISEDGSQVTDSGRPLAFDPAVTRIVLRYCREIDSNLDRGRGLWFEGEVGTGKTTLAMLVSRCALEAGRSVAIYSMPRLLADVRNTFGRDATDSYQSLIDRLTRVDLLHIDDVGAEQQTEWVLEQLYAIVNQRYEDGRALLITTNLGIEQLKQQVTERTVSRLAQICGTAIPLMGEDRRMVVSLASA